jgi:hypothetical protein
MINSSNNHNFLDIPKYKLDSVSYLCPIQQYDKFFVEDLPYTIAAEVSERIRKM